MEFLLESTEEFHPLLQIWRAVRSISRSRKPRYEHVLATVPASSKLICATEPLTRVGLHQVAVHDGTLIKQILMGDIKIIENDANGITRVMLRSNTSVGGHMAPGGTLVMLDQGRYSTDLQ
jgi:hypothetical protein